MVSKEHRSRICQPSSNETRIDGPRSTAEFLLRVSGARWKSGPLGPRKDRLFVCHSERLRGTLTLSLPKGNGD
jgi:hypothetical protein